MQRLHPQTSLVLIVDIQERLVVAMPTDRQARLLRASRILLDAASELKVPVLATEQYPKGLGETVAPLREQLSALSAPRMAKTSFSACDTEAIAAAIDASPGDIVVVGIEAHVCVYQTVRDLLARGRRVWLAADGVASRDEEHRALALEECRRLGARITTAEAVAFDWVRDAAASSFKAISKAVR